MSTVYEPTRVATKGGAMIGTVPVSRPTCETPVTAVKQCTRCGLRPRRAKDQRWCKPCHASAVKRWRDKQRAEVRAMKWELHQRQSMSAAV
jgi:hypothetical protein